MTTANFIKRTKGYDKSSKTIEDTYQVNVDTANDVDSAIAAVEAMAVPANYATDGVSATHINRNPMWYEARVTYKQSTSGGGGGADDPLSRPSVLSMSYEEWEEPYDVDHSDTPLTVANSAGDPFQTFPQRKNGTMNIQIAKNFASFAAGPYDAIKFTTNATSVTIRGAVFLADTLLFLPPTAQEVWEQIGTTTHHYYAVTFRLAADAGKHLHQVADRGYRQIVNGKHVKIRDGDQQPTEDPWPLDGGGVAKASAADAPATRTFQPYASASWGIDFS